MFDPHFFLVAVAFHAALSGLRGGSWPATPEEWDRLFRDSFRVGTSMWLVWLSMVPGDLVEAGGGLAEGRP